MNDLMDLCGGLARAFAAGVKAANENNESERKLRRLIDRATQAEALLRAGWAQEGLHQLSAALEEARKP